MPEGLSVIDFDQGTEEEVTEGDLDAVLKGLFPLLLNQTVPRTHLRSFVGLLDPDRPTTLCEQQSSEV